jgi:hypothetical protein
VAEYFFLMQAQQKLKGECRCTKYQFEVHVKPTWVGLCHCLDCQKGCGGPYLYIYYFDGAPVKLTKGDESELIVSQSGAYFNKRCSCGSPVYSEKIVDGKIQAQDVFHGSLVNMGNDDLLCQPEYRPRDHIWYNRRVFDVNDGATKWHGQFEFKIEESLESSN